MLRIDDLEGTVLQNRCIVPGHYLLAFRLERKMAAPRPGQFVMLKVPGADIFLRRPFSVYQYGRGVLSILYKVAGRGRPRYPARVAVTKCGSSARWATGLHRCPVTRPCSSQAA